VIHTRNSKNEVFETLQKNNAKKYILHCFSEDLEFAKKNIEYSSECKISFSGIVTYKSALEVQKAASTLPYSRIIVETDSPYLAPQPVRGTQNIPNNTRYTLEKVYELQKQN
jgi:TatD DNase family protein